MGLITGTAKVCTAVLILYVFALFIDGEFGVLRAMGITVLDGVYGVASLGEQTLAAIFMIGFFGYMWYSQR